MVVVQIRQCVDPKDTPPNRWTVEIRVGDAREFIQIENPFTPEQEKDVYWYMEDYVNNPYEITKSTAIHVSLRNYANKLASAISNTGLFPTRGDLELEIEGADPHGQTSLQNLARGHSMLILHWELLEDLSMWPTGFKLGSVTVRRLVSPRSVWGTTAVEPVPDKALSPGAAFNILLVICRPKHRKDIEYQLVSRSLLNIIDQIRTDKRIRVKLTILRPPTWENFVDHLTNQEVPGRYQLVHFDMHGSVNKSATGEITASLRFSRYDYNAQEIYQTKGRLKSAQDIASVLLKAKVPCVIANACDSASVAHGSTTGNFAQLLVQSGIPFVLAMSYQIIDNAVGLFMETFYKSLLLRGRDMSQSAHDGRQALLKAPLRTTRFLQKIKIADYFVPVCYHDKRIPPLRISPHRPQKLKGSTQLLAIFKLPGSRSHTRFCKNSAHRAITSSNTSVPEKRASDRPSSVSKLRAVFSRHSATRSLDEEIVGRDHNILEMEHILKHSRKLLLYGQGGCGKTSLLKYCETWWNKTNLTGKCFYFDFATLLDTDGNFEGLLAGLSKVLSPSDIGLAEDDILEHLRNQEIPAVLIFDSMETLDSPGFWMTARFPKPEQEKLWSFLKRACRCDTYLVFASRVAKGPGLDRVPGLIPYYLDGLSVSASALLAEQLIKSKAPSGGVEISTGESVGYLRRIFILLEGNPEAIMAVLPNLWKSKISSLELFKTLLVGTCHLDEDISRDSRFLKTIRSVSAEQEFYSAFGTGYIIPWQLFPFWNVIPRKLDAYFYFTYWRLGGLLGYFAQERSYHYSSAIDFEIDAFEVNGKFRTDETLERIFKSLEKAGILHPIQATCTGPGLDHELWHIHPLFTLCARNMASEEVLRAGIYAFVRHQTLWGRQALADSDSRIVQLTWGNEAQHVDHLWNNQIAALMISLNSDIVEEMDIHGISMTDVLLHPAEEGFHHNRRLNELVRPIVKEHIGRLLALPGLRGDGIFLVDEMDELMTNVSRFVEYDNGDISEVLDLALSMCRAWQREMPDPKIYWPSSLEQSWLELVLARCKLTMRDNRLRAKKEFEEALQTDPLSAPSDPLFGAIRRVYGRMLVYWVECAAYQMGLEHDIDEKTIVMNGAKEFVKFSEGAKIGNMFENIWTSSRLQPEWHRPVRDVVGFFQKYSTDIHKFCSVVETILDDPIWKMFAMNRDCTFEEHAAEAAKPGKINKSIAAVTEYNVRSLAGEGASAQGLMDRVIAEQLSSSSAGPMELLALHEMLYFEAKQHGDWLKALKLLDEMERLQHRISMSPEQQAHFHVRYAGSLDELNRGDECAHWILRASDLLANSPDEREQAFFLNSSRDYKCLEAVLNSKGTLSSTERRKLRHVLTQAQEHGKKLEYVRKGLDDWSQVRKEAQMTLRQKGSEA